MLDADFHCDGSMTKELCVIPQGIEPCPAQSTGSAVRLVGRKHVLSKRKYAAQLYAPSGALLFASFVGQPFVPTPGSHRLLGSTARWTPCASNRCARKDPGSGSHAQRRGCFAFWESGWGSG